MTFWETVKAIFTKAKAASQPDCVIERKKFDGTYTSDLKARYTCLWRKLVINSDRMTEVDAIVNRIKENKSKYEGVSQDLGGKIPWYFIGVIHNMESSLSFTKHLHNGDPLSARTKNVPAGRPLKGKPPFSWGESAVDALEIKGFHKLTSWTIEEVLYRLEKFNGLGYMKFHPEVLSPYLFSGSNHYTKGKYIADGQWSREAISGQIGAAVLLKRMEERNIISI